MIDARGRLPPSYATAVAFILLAGCVLSGQEDERIASVTGVRRKVSEVQATALRINVRHVLVPVTVTDATEHLITGLPKSAFRVFEDGVEQEITTFSREDTPVSMGILLDASASMIRKIEASRQAISTFLRHAAQDDEFFLMRFSDNPQQLQGFTRDSALIDDAVRRIAPGGWTALYDAICLGMRQLQKASHGRRVLLVLSDGADNNSRYTETEIRNMVREGDVRVYAMSILDRSPVLETLAEESGGRAHRVRRLEDLSDLAVRVSAEMHGEYVLGYPAPASANDGKYRRIRVELKPEFAARNRLSWRRGYYGPGY